MSSSSGGSQSGAGPSPQAQAAALFQQAMDLFGKGKLAQAVPLFEQILRLAPNAAPALHFLGLAYHQLGNDEQGLPLLRQAWKADGRQPAYGINLGLVLSELGRLEEAVSILESARQQGHAVPELFNNLGQVHLRLGNAEQAIGCFQRALELRPAFAQALNNLGSAFSQLGRHSEAIGALQTARQLLPTSPAVLNNLGRALTAAKEPREAADCFQAALKLHPHDAEAALGLVQLLEAGGQLGQAIELCQASVAANAQNLPLRLHLGALLRRTGQYAAARACFQQAAALAPRSFRAQWQAALFLPAFYASEAEMAQARAGWRQGLQQLEAKLDQQECAPDTITLPHTNFYLHYQCGNDRAAQADYGRLVTRIAQGQVSGLAAPRRHQGSPDRKIRVGFASAFFNLHTIFKLFHGWVTRLDPNRFETFVFQFSNVRDKATDYLAQHATRLVAGALPLRAAAEAILRAELDVLIYPDIGMDAFMQMLAALRLAPIQCQAWGHPVTSGLPAIDYFLSSELMEPAGAQAHYNERLICLPGLSIYYPEPDTRVAVCPPGLPPKNGKTCFVCLQSLFKLLPGNDALFARVLARVPNSQLLFISHPSPQLTALYRERLHQALRAAGVAPDRILFLPQLKYGEFLGLIQHADITLDTLGWSGGNTSLEALAFGKPLVTLPGEFLRGRHTMAILRRIGLPDTIAKDEAHYVELAARLAEDSHWREDLTGRLLQHKALAYRDDQAIRSLEAFLEQLDCMSSHFA